MTLAQQQSVSIARLRKLVVFDRLMARLTAVAPDRWILKGGVALQYRVGFQFRTTKDVDFGRGDEEAAATTDFLAAQSVDLRDYFILAVERTRQAGAAVRYHAAMQLAGRGFDDVIVDVGFGDPTTFEPDVVRGPDLLGFADIPPVEVPAISLEQHVAEKVHAYTRSYASGYPSTRVKDLADLVTLSSKFSFDASRLRQALENTFASRDTHSLPPAFSSNPSEWRVAYRILAAEAGLDPDVREAYDQTRTFLAPILDWGGKPDSGWDPTRRSWQ